MRLRRRRPAGHHAARAPRPALLLRPPLHHAQRARVADPPGRGAAEHRDLPPHRRRHGARPPAPARQRRGPRARSCWRAPASRTRSCVRRRTPG